MGGQPMAERRSGLYVLWCAGWKYSNSCSDQCCILGNNAGTSRSRVVPLLTCFRHPAVPLWHITSQPASLSCKSAMFRCFYLDYWFMVKATYCPIQWSTLMSAATMAVTTVHFTFHKKNNTTSCDVTILSVCCYVTAVLCITK